MLCLIYNNVFIINETLFDVNDVIIFDNGIDCGGCDDVFLNCECGGKFNDDVSLRFDSK
jgi:hypothetical protein